MSVLGKLWNLWPGPHSGLGWHLATWLGHAFVGALAVYIVSPLKELGIVDLRSHVLAAVGGFYLFREVEQLLWGSGAPWWDSLGDVLAPWLGGGLVLWLTR